MNNVNLDRTFFFTRFGYWRRDVRVPVRVYDDRQVKKNMLVETIMWNYKMLHVHYCQYYRNLFGKKSNGFRMSYNV